MRIKDSSTPVLILGCKIGALAIMRSLGSQGVPVYGIDDNPQSPALYSRFLEAKFIQRYDEDRPDTYLDYVLAIGKRLGQRAILIPTSDELTIFVEENSRHLKSHFLFPENPPGLLKRLASKDQMFHLALENGVSTASTSFPRNIDDVLSFSKSISYPVMLKGIHGNRLQARTGEKMVIVNSKEELIKNYQQLEDPDSPNLMIQEYIPGGDDQVHIFNGYFNEQSDCLAAFTGFKVRQSPIHLGCASLGECRWNEEVAKTTENFMYKIGYRGILDIGYRLDPRDGLYKVLDINPRVGQAFRIFVAENGMDVVRALYLDLTGQKLFPVTPIEGRRWIIEDYDFIFSSFDYYREGTLGIIEWLKSFKGIEEGAWFSWKDPVPFLKMMQGYCKRFVSYIFRKCNFRT